MTERPGSGAGPSQNVNTPVVVNQEQHTGHFRLIYHLSVKLGWAATSISRNVVFHLTPAISHREVLSTQRIVKLRTTRAQLTTIRLDNI